MLCMFRDKTTYVTLFQKMTAKMPGLKVFLQAYSTDGEKPLRQALGQELERSVAFLRKNHVKENIQDKCSKLQISQAVTDVIVNDIFGSEALVYASNERLYRSKLEELKQKWDNTELADMRREPRFSSYFLKCEADEIWNHVSAKVSNDAGFGDEVQCNNVSESGYAVMKHWQNFESKDMSTFVDDVKELVDKQRSDVQRAFLGLHGLYIVRPEYQDHVQLCEILDTTPKERGNIINSVKVVVDPVRYKQLINYHTTPMLPLGVFEEGEETGEESEGDRPPCMMQTNTSSCGDEEGQVSKPMPSKQPDKKAGGCLITEYLENLLDTFIGKDIKALADKASKLQSDDAIRKGFDDDTYFVKSTSTSQPHVVKRATGSRDGAGYSCDKECLGFVSRKICAHAVAVAHYSSNLKQFVSWFKNTRRNQDNLAALTTFSVNKAAGKKNPINAGSRLM